MFRTRKTQELERLRRDVDGFAHTLARIETQLRHIQQPPPPEPVSVPEPEPEPESVPEPVKPVAEVPSDTPPDEKQETASIRLTVEESKLLAHYAEKRGKTKSDVIRLGLKTLSNQPHGDYNLANCKVSLGYLMHQMRVMAGKTRAELGRELRCSVPMIKEYEMGTTMPSQETLAKFTKAVGTVKVSVPVVVPASKPQPLPQTLSQKSLEPEGKVNHTYYAKNLRFYRHQRGMTQAELGYLSDIKAHRISQYERHVRTVNDGAASKLAATLNVKVHDLMGWAKPE